MSEYAITHTEDSAPMLDLWEPDHVCAECGTTTATTYVVSTLDTSDVRSTRTEICRECDNALREVVG